MIITNIHEPFHISSECMFLTHTKIFRLQSNILGNISHFSFLKIFEGELLVMF